MVTDTMRKTPIDGKHPDMKKRIIALAACTILALGVASCTLPKPRETNETRETMFPAESQKPSAQEIEKTEKRDTEAKIIGDRVEGYYGSMLNPYTLDYISAFVEARQRVLAGEDLPGDSVDMVATGLIDTYGDYYWESAASTSQEADLVPMPHYMQQTIILASKIVTRSDELEPAGVKPLTSKTSFHVDTDTIEFSEDMESATIATKDIKYNYEGKEFSNTTIDAIEPGGYSSDELELVKKEGEWYIVQDAVSQSDAEEFMAEMA